MEEEKIIFCKSGGCTAKLGAGVLEHILEKLPKGEKDPNLLLGYDSKDDASVYRLTDDLAMVQTLDFFPPVVEDPYTFGKIAAANALSDIYAMGGEVRTALNIVCFPEQMDLNVLGEIMRGGAEKVQEAGGSLSGGHSIADDSVKYGLSVTGTVHPDRIWQNNTGRVGDLLILTKPLGTGILCAAHRVGEENPGGFQKAVESMMTLNKYASETARKYNIHACTDVTGFSFLGHLHEMMESGVSCHIWADQIPVFPGAVEAAEEFLITAAGQRNRNYLEQHVTFKDIPFGMQEVLFDPQTSGGLLMAVDAVDAEKMQRKLLEQGIPAAIVGKVTEPHEMMESGVSCHIWADQIPVFPGAVEAAEEFLITAAGQRNRNYLEQHVTFKDIPFGMQEVLFDPQTSGGLLMAVDAVDAEKMQRKLLEQGIPAAIVGKVTEPAGTEIYVTQSRKW